LLDFSIIRYGRVQLFHITAFPLPKHRTNLKLLPYTRLSAIANRDKSSLLAVSSALRYSKDFVMVRNHFKLRKVLFSDAVQKTSLLQQQKKRRRDKKKLIQTLLFRSFLKKKFLKKN